MICTEARSILDIDEACWNAITGDVLSMTHAWLRVMEAHFNFYQPYYILFEDEQGPTAAIVADLYVSFTHLSLLGWLHQRISLPVRPPFSSFCGVMVRPGVSLEAVMPEVDAVLKRLAWREKRLVTTVSNVVTSDLASWRQAGFLASPKPKVGYIDLPATYEQYLETLRTKDQQELRRARRRGEKFDLHFEAGPLLDDSEQIYALFCEVFTSHGTSLESVPFSSQFPTALNREMPGDAFFLRGYAGEKLAGVGLCLRQGDTLWAPLIGLNYEIARPSYLYFLLMDETVRLGIDLGLEKLFLGQTNERLKQRHGFHFEERWLCYRSSIDPLNQILSWILPRLQH